MEKIEDTQQRLFKRIDRFTQGLEGDGHKPRKSSLIIPALVAVMTAAKVAQRCLSVDLGTFFSNWKERDQPRQVKVLEPAADNQDPFLDPAARSHDPRQHRAV